MPVSQVPVTGPYPRQDESNPIPPCYVFSMIIIFPSHQYHSEQEDMSGNETRLESVFSECKQGVIRVKSTRNYYDSWRFTAPSQKSASVK